MKGIEQLVGEFRAAKAAAKGVNRRLSCGDESTFEGQVIYFEEAMGSCTFQSEIQNNGGMEEVLSDLVGQWNQRNPDRLATNDQLLDARARFELPIRVELPSVVKSNIMV